MKKKILFALLLLLSLTLGYAQLLGGGNGLQSPTMGSVRQYLEERQLLSSHLNQQGDMPAKYVPSRMVDGVEMIDAFIAVDGTGTLDQLRAAGVIINCEFDGFVTAHIPVARLIDVSRIDGVKDIEISRVLDQCTDTTLSVTRAGQVIDGSATGLPMPFDGSGVIIGIIDSGFDYQHSAFKNALDPSKSRIVRIYDSQDATGHPVIVGNNVLDGSVFMGDQIDTLKYDTKGTHGTHTASIAAGRHMGPYGGMAPGADIVLCSSRTLNTGINEIEVANCIKYIFSYADSVGKPCVISLSVSTSAGSHDGKEYLTKAINQSVGPGRIFVIAAGNNGAKNFYVHGPATRQAPCNVLINCSSNNADDNYFYNNLALESWIRQPGARPYVTFHILDKTTNKIVWESAPVTQTSTISHSLVKDFFEPNPSVGNTGFLYASITMNVNNSKFKVTSKISNLRSKSYYYGADGKIISNYRLGMSIYPRFVDSIYVDNWMGTSVGAFGKMTAPVYIDTISDQGETVTVEMPNYYRIPDFSSSIGSFAVGDSIISAGYYNGKNKYFALNRDSVVLEPWITVGSINGNSGFQSPGAGPTGMPLPTVTAPGYNVVAAGSQYSYYSIAGRGELVMRDEEGSLWGIMSGTSMAAPTVAGIIAQWLQVNPKLSPSQIKNVIAQTAIKDNFTLANNRFGPNGKIDALAGVQYLYDNGLALMVGDVNDDGLVSIRDVILMIDYLLGTEMAGFNHYAADVSRDGVITIKDVTMLVDFLLSGENDTEEVHVF